MKYYITNLIIIAIVLASIMLAIVLVLGIIYTCIMPKAIAFAVFSTTIKIAFIIWIYLSVIITTIATYPYFQFIKYTKIIKETNDDEIKSYYYDKIKNQLKEKIPSQDFKLLEIDYLDS